MIGSNDFLLFTLWWHIIDVFTSIKIFVDGHVVCHLCFFWIFILVIMSILPCEMFTRVTFHVSLKACQVGFLITLIHFFFWFFLDSILLGKFHSDLIPSETYSILDGLSFNSFAFVGLYYFFVTSKKMSFPKIIVTIL